MDGVVYKKLDEINKVYKNVKNFPNGEYYNNFPIEQNVEVYSDFYDMERLLLTSTSGSDGEIVKVYSSSVGSMALKVPKGKYIRYREACNVNKGPRELYYNIQIKNPETIQSWFGDNPPKDCLVNLYFVGLRLYYNGDITSNVLGTTNISGNNSITLNKKENINVDPYEGINDWINIGKSINNTQFLLNLPNAGYEAEDIFLPDGDRKSIRINENDRIELFQLIPDLYITVKPYGSSTIQDASRLAEFLRIFLQIRIKIVSGDKKDVFRAFSTESYRIVE